MVINFLTKFTGKSKIIKPPPKGFGAITSALLRPIRGIPVGLSIDSEGL
jgi:hypothetical protein